MKVAERHFVSQSMVLSVVINGRLALAIIISILFCIGD